MTTATPTPCRIWEHVTTATLSIGDESYDLALEAQWTEGSPRDRYQASVYWKGDASEPIGTTILFRRCDAALGDAAALAYAHYEGLQEPTL